MNRWVVSSQVLTQAFSISLYLLNNIYLLIYSSIHPNGRVKTRIYSLTSCFSLLTRAWTDRRTDASDYLKTTQTT